MSKISKFLKLDKNILLEYIYDSGNLLNEPYQVLVNSRSSLNSYISSSTSVSKNTINNSLFLIDPVSRKLGKSNSTSYSFLQTKNYSQPGPIKHDKLRFHLPINWTFGEYIGFYVNVYAFDRQNRVKYDLSNFYFDITDLNQQDLMDFTSPPLLYLEKLWGKNITIDIPSVDSISNQLTNNLPTENSINSNLTSGMGLSLTTPIFIDFSFITKKQVVGDITTYLSKSPISSSVPQTPEFERLGLMIRSSNNGDYFEIFGTYNGNIGEFNKFINDSVQQGNRYYVQYNITIFEQNIRGKTTTITITDNFNETIEYRPIIKYSTTTAVIDVEMRLIDMVDDSYIIRKASYGMLQDEVSKYSLRLSKINLKNAFKPKIYNIKNSVNPSMVNGSNSMGFVNNGSNGFGSGGFGSGGFGSDGDLLNTNNVQVVRVPFPVLVEKFNVIGKSENAIFNNNVFYGNSRIQIVLYPFDNVVKFILATGESTAPEYMDLTKYNDISFVIRNDVDSVIFPLYTESEEIELSIGQIVFKLDKNKYTRIKNIYDSGINIFYIIGTNQNVTSVIYNGLFKIFESRDNISALNDDVSSNLTDTIIDDPDLSRTTQGTAVVTRRRITEQTDPTKRNNI